MSLVKSVFYSAAQLLPLAVLKQRHPGQLLLPYQHLVSDEPVPHIRHLYAYKGVQAFEEDLDYLLRRFTPVGLPDVLHALKTGTALPAGAFLLSFDDGLREVKDTIAPILLRKGVPAVFFLNSAFLDNRHLFYRFKLSLIIDALLYIDPAILRQLATYLQCDGDHHSLITAVKKITYKTRRMADEAGGILGLSFSTYLSTVQPFLTLDDVGTLLDQGFAIGGHSIDHPYYSQLTLDEQLFQTRQSVDFLVQHFHLSYRVFAIPHTDAGISEIFFNTLLEGPDPLDIIFGTANQRTDISPRILHRFNCEHPFFKINSTIKGLLLLKGLHQLTNRDRIIR
jgi:peptidoglycan/xylan/chitin deacetylase (PgdA/CDA1 family)